MLLLRFQLRYRLCLYCPLWFLPVEMARLENWLATLCRQLLVCHNRHQTQSIVLERTCHWLSLLKLWQQHIQQYQLQMSTSCKSWRIDLRLGHWLDGFKRQILMVFKRPTLPGSTNPSLFDWVKFCGVPLFWPVLRIFPFMRTYSLREPEIAKRGRGKPWKVNSIERGRVCYSWRSVLSLHSTPYWLAKLSSLRILCFNCFQSIFSMAKTICSLSHGLKMLRHFLISSSSVFESIP